jgi:hypothetical protein
MLSFKPASNIITTMFTWDFALDALHAQILHLKFTAASADYDYLSWRLYIYSASKYLGRNWELENCEGTSRQGNTLRSHNICFYGPP